MILIWWPFLNLKPTLLYKLAKNVASNPKGLEIFLTANFGGP